MAWNEPAAGEASAKPPAIFLMGPTATGKTDLAVALAEHFPVEIISVDSALVYRGLDIGSAKPDAATRASVPHHLIDIRDPAEPYSVADFARDARRLADDITARGAVPLLAGGTMLYFRALREGLAELPSADPALRAEIEREAQSLGWPALHERLAQVDPVAAERIHPRHSQRIQRALEIHRLTGRPPSEARAQAGGIPPLIDDYAVTQIALLPRDRRLLHERIDRRFAAMLEAGLVEEVAALYRRGDLTPELPAIRAVGYRQVWDYLDGRCDYDRMAEKGKAATRQLAKRQLTWLRRWPDLHRLYIDDTGGRALSLQEIVNKFLKILRNGPIYGYGTKLV